MGRDGNKHCETQQHERKAQYKEPCSFAVFIRNKGSCDSEDGSCDIDRYSQQLCLAGGVMEAFDNSRQEEANSVQRTDNLGHVNFG